MKNKFITFFLISVFTLCNIGQVFAEEFIFEVSDLEITENGNVYKGNNRGTIRTDNQLKLISNNFEYLKKINRLEANGDVQLFDLNNNITINAQQIFYLKNEEKIFTVGKTLIKISNKYNIEGFDLTLFKNKMILSSKKSAIITDSESNTYKLEQFQYSIDKEILKGKNITAITNDKKNKSDEFFFKTGFFDLKKNKFLGKDIVAKFHKDLFGDDENDPRINAVSGYGDKFNTYFQKGVFTSCKKTDKCPPWKITSDEIHHDKIKKQINYKNAWLELYDFPVVYFPKFFHPDPSVKRQSGFLMPSLTSSANLGSSFNLPYYHVISDDKDLTIKPRLYSNQKALIQTEFRGVKAKSEYSLDFGNTINDEKSNKGHIFAKYKGEIDLLNFETTELNINIQQTSDDTYLKAYKVNSPIIDNTNLLNSSLEIDAYREDLSFNANLSVIEDLSKKNSDRYEFVYPSYIISKQLNNINFLNGESVLNSSGYMKNYNTNIFEKVIVNDFLFNSEFKINENGFKNNYNFLIKNVNTDAKNSLKYKTKQNYELASIFEYNLSYPLKKSNKNNYNLLNPLASIKFSPNNNKDLRNDSRRIDINNIFSLNRLGKQDTVEGGTSLTYGIEYSKNSLSDIEIFKSSIASVVRYDKDDNLPKESKLGNKNSDIVGGLSYIPNHILKLNYDFSLDNNFTDTNYQILGADIKINNFVTSFEYLNDNNSVNEESFYTSKSALTIDDAQEVIFETRQNKKTKATEFYNIIYQYRNDCLIAALEYNKDYYNDGDLKPEENIFFKLTIVPFGQTSTPNLIK